MRTGARRALAVAVGIGAIAAGTDRVSLAMWNASINKLVARLKSEAAAPQRTWTSERNWQTLFYNFNPNYPPPPKHPYPCPALLSLGTRPRPAFITVDGGCGLHLTFAPPILAWSIWVLPPPERFQHDFGASARFLSHERTISIQSIDPITRAPLAHPLVVEERLVHGG